jgi:hypothetical protein
MELHWQIQEKQGETAAEDLGFLGKAYQEVASRGLAISCMPFQDAWTIDLNRLRNCCLHVATPDGNITPFCAYYLTSAGGKRIRHTPGQAKGI